MRRVVQNTAPYETLPKSGDHRYKRQFLWQSMIIGREKRRYELTHWREEWKKVWHMGLGCREYEYKWVPVEWVNFT